MINIADGTGTDTIEKTIVCKQRLCYMGVNLRKAPERCAADFEKIVRGGMGLLHHQANREFLKIPG